MVSPFYQRGDWLPQQVVRARVGGASLPSKFGFAIDLCKVAVLRPYSADIRLERYDDDQLILWLMVPGRGMFCRNRD